MPKPASPVADEYDMFSGHPDKSTRAYPHGAERSTAAGLGSRLAPLDYGKEKNVVASKWVVFSSKNVKQHDLTGTNGADLKVKAKGVSDMSDEAIAAWREQHTVTIFGDNCPPPLTRFDQLGESVPDSVFKSFQLQKFTAPTPIQAQAWPILQQNRDMVGIAKTGSGKTLAFMIPAIAHIEVQPPLQRGDGPICLVLAPTRELAQQIEEETKKVLPKHLRSACIYGGSSKGPQLMALSAGAHVLIATPGRLIDFLQVRKTSLTRVTFLVLDEADRMLDMGFEPQVRAICGQIRTDRQTLMFSATWPQEIQAMAASFQREFIRIHIGSTELTANTDVTQHFVFTSEYEKFMELRKLLTKFSGKRVLIFAKMKRTTEQLERQLRGIGANAMSIHGDKEQQQREFILKKFKREAMVLIATDVAARGLDVKELEYVINYDFPMQIDDYIHRIGRTGRAGMKGHAYTILTKQEDQVTPYIVERLVGILEKAKQFVPEELKEWASKSRGPPPSSKPGYGKNNKVPSFSYNVGNRVSGTQAAPSSSTFFGVSSGAGEKRAPARQVFDSDDDEVEAPKKKGHRAE